MAVAGAIGFCASVVAGVLVILATAWLQQPDLVVAEEPYGEDLTYSVTRIPPGTEVRLRDDLTPKPAGSYAKDLTYYSLWVENRAHAKWPLSMFPRNMAWAARARITFKAFTPGSTIGNPTSFGFFGRWAGAPEPSGVGTIELGRYIEIPPSRRVSLTLAQKYQGDFSAWGFTNESYLYVASGQGLWRHPDFEMTNGTHWLIAVEFESTKRFRAEKFHAQVTGSGRRDFTLHRTDACSDCRDLK